MLTLRLPLEPRQLAAFLLAAASLLFTLDLRAQSTVPPTDTPCEVDFFPDGVVGAYDILYLLSGISCSTPECVAAFDVTEDNAVGSADVLVVLSVYGEDCDL